MDIHEILCCDTGYVRLAVLLSLLSGLAASVFLVSSFGRSRSPLALILANFALSLTCALIIAFYVGYQEGSYQMWRVFSKSTLSFADGYPHTRFVAFVAIGLVSLVLNLGSAVKCSRRTSGT